MNEAVNNIDRAVKGNDHDLNKVNIDFRNNFIHIDDAYEAAMNELDRNIQAYRLLLENNQISKTYFNIFN